MNRNILLACSVSIGMLTGCQDTFTDPPTAPLADEYYPLEVGRSITYQVDSIEYYETVANDTATWELKETIVDTFYDNQGRLNFRIERSIRQPGGNWQLSEVWSVLNNESKIERTEQNLKFIRLISPVETGGEWNAHLYLSDLSTIPVNQQCNNLSFLEDWNYSYKEVGASRTFNGLDFNNTATVMQTGEQNLIEFNECEEVYAKGVGMVYRFFRHYTTQNICPECEWEENTECGYSVKMSVIEYN